MKLIKIIILTNIINNIYAAEYTDVPSTPNAIEVLQNFKDNDGFVIPTAIKKHKCTWDGCDYVASKKSHLDSHIRIHTGEKPFICNAEGCTYASSQKSNLVIHIRTHTGEKPFICYVEGCDYAASQRSALNVHIRKHTGSFFRCRVNGCDYAAAHRSALVIYAAAQKYTLNRHMKIHTKKRSYDEISIPSILLQKKYLQTLLKD